MKDEVKLEKLTGLEEWLSDYPAVVCDLFEELCTKTDPEIQEDVKLLSESIYAEGFKDGILFFDWLTAKAENGRAK